MQWWYTSRVMCHLAVETSLLLRTCTASKIQFSEDTGRIFEDILQQGKSGNVTNKVLRNMQHRPKAWGRQTESCTYWKERDHCGLNDRHTKPQIPEKTYHSTRQIPKETDLTKFSIVQIIHCIFGWRYILFTNRLAVYYC